MKFSLTPKTVAIAVGAVLGALALAVILFIAFFPADLAAREAERRIEAATGRDLVLGGKVQVSFWPALGFSAEHASLSNPEGFPQDEPFIAADRIVFAVAVMPLLRGEIEVKQLIFEGGEVRLQAQPDGAANWTFPTEETAPEEQTTIEDLRLDDVRLIDGLITFQGGDGGPPLTLEDVDASLSLESLDAPAAIDAAFDYRGERVTVDGDIGLPRAVLEKGETPIAARVRSARLNAEFDGGFNAETGALRGALQANGASLRRLLAWIGSPMDQGGGFGAFRFTGQMAREGDTIDLNDAAIRLDDIEARGNVSLVSQESGRLRVNGTLSSGNVDLNPYLPAPAQGREQGVDVDTAWSQSPLDLSGLRALDANLNLTLAALRFQRMSFSDVALNLRVANGAADARLSRISLYGGGGTARLIADGSGATPRVAVEIDAQNVQAEPLLTDAIGFDKIVGRGRLTASLVGQGASQSAIMRSLRGNASFMFNDGQWKGVNLAQVARTVQSALSGQAAGQGAATDFAELGASFAVANGVAATENLRLLNPFVRLEGRGLVDIGAQTIDMRIVPRAVRSIEGQGGEASVTGIGVPFRVSGPWARVSFRPALEDVVQSQLRDIISQQEQGSPLATLGDILFGRQPATSEEAPTETPAETPAEQPAEGEATPPAEAPQQQQPRNPLEDLLRRALGGEQEKQEETPTP
jgi:AsmA protein